MKVPPNSLEVLLYQLAIDEVISGVSVNDHKDYLKDMWEDVEYVLQDEPEKLKELKKCLE